jgi:hypothetical protein
MPSDQSAGVFQSAMAPFQLAVTVIIPSPGLMPFGNSAEHIVNDSRNDPAWRWTCNYDAPQTTPHHPWG